MTEEELLKIDDYVEFYDKIPVGVQKFVRHAYELGFADGWSSYESEIIMVRDTMIREMTKGELS